MIENNTKKCRECEQIKSITDFQVNRSTNDGFHRMCKSCYSTHRKLIRNNNKKHYKEYAIKQYDKNKNDWLKFFQTHYGLTPQCAICKTGLRWQSNCGKFEDDLVCWDHFSEESKALTMPPSCWLGSHICNETNQFKWMLFHLGILCGRCNAFLPTLNRIEWLEKALIYSKDHLSNIKDHQKWD